MVTPTLEMVTPTPLLRGEAAHGKSSGQRLVQAKGSTESITTVQQALLFLSLWRCPLDPSLHTWRIIAPNPQQEQGKDEVPALPVSRAAVLHALLLLFLPLAQVLESDLGFATRCSDMLCTPSWPK